MTSESILRPFRRRYRELAERDVSLGIRPPHSIVVMAGASAPAPIKTGEHRWHGLAHDPREYTP